MKRIGAIVALAAVVVAASACSGSGGGTAAARSTTTTTGPSAAAARPAPCPPATLPPGTPLDGATLRWTADCVPFVRTPDERFAKLPDFPYEPHYADVDGLRMAYEDEGPRNGQVVLLLHGEPTWSYLYRKMIPILADAGYRVIAPDMIGMGRSDKPVQLSDYSYLQHVRWVTEFVESLGLRNVTAFVQDWGSLIGLRVIGDHPERFARVVVANGRLPVVPAGFRLVTVPDPPVPNAEYRLPFSPGAPTIPVQHVPFVTDAFAQWTVYALTGTHFRASEVVKALASEPLSKAELAAYDAPFPDRVFMSGARVFPSLINTIGTVPTNDGARRVFDAWTKPMLTLFGRRDPNLGTEAIQAEMRDHVPGAQGQAHHAYEDAGHFVQEDVGADLAHRVDAFIRQNPVAAQSG